MSQSKLKKSYPLFHASEDRANVVPVFERKTGTAKIVSDGQFFIDGLLPCTFFVFEKVRHKARLVAHVITSVHVVPVILKKLYSTHAYACIGEYRGDIKHQRCVPSVNQAQSAVMCAGNGTT